jgi:hypothetical protein
VEPETFAHHKVFMTIRPIQAASLAHAAYSDSETNMETLTITLALMLSCLRVKLFKTALPAIDDFSWRFVAPCERVLVRKRVSPRTRKLLPPPRLDFQTTVREIPPARRIAGIGTAEKLLGVFRCVFRGLFHSGAK